MSGALVVVGLGPGSPQTLTPEAAAALEGADALYGYGPYLDRVPGKPGQTRHASDNREEGSRAAAALRHAAQGAKVAMVSGGDPGVFAMAAAVFEAVEAGDPAWRSLDIRVEPGVTAMLAAAAEADFVIALYNPASKARPYQLGEAFALLRTVKAAETPVLLVRAAGSGDAKVIATTLAEVDATQADMRTLVIVGASTTRQVGRWIYTPRGARP